MVSHEMNQSDLNGEGWRTEALVQVKEAAQIP